MLRVVPHKSAAAARHYYAEGLRREDYYSQGQEIVGKWHGKAAVRLGLSGDVTPDAFQALVENKHPKTGARLTPRTKADRVVGWDLNFHVPKSLSVLHALTGDPKILKAFREAVAETMGHIEGEVATRMRKGKTYSDQVTGNLAWAEFVHFTARPVGGVPDPHLHIHAFAFNCTFDEGEGRWKAAKFRDIKEHASYSEALFHSLLTAKLSDLGYGIERTSKGWEIAGIPRSVIEKFSRRSALIEKTAAAKGITDPKAKDALGAATRESKRKGFTDAELRAEWEKRLSAAEKEEVRAAGKIGARLPAQGQASARDAVEYACEKLFAKSSVVPQRQLVAEALRYGVGGVRPEEVWRAFEKTDLLVKELKGDAFCTSLSVLAEEVALINFVRAGRNAHAPIGSKDFKSAKLSAEQGAAVRHILNSRDQVIAVKGGAGVGKTTLMREAVAQMEASGLRVFAFAPSAAASRGTLRESGFSNAETVAYLLNNVRLQQETPGQVIWIDEAGLLGVRDMWQIMRIAGDSTRVILTGDTNQHAPVARGDAFRLLQNYAGLKVAQVTQIRRQEVENYRHAISALAKGDLRAGFRHLETLGAIREIEDAEERYRTLAADFLALSRGKSVPLVVSPTHAEGAAVTEAIRDARREAGQLGKSRTFLQYHNLQWEEADRKRADNYAADMMVQFHQNSRGIQRGQIFRVTGHDVDGAVKMATASGAEMRLPLLHAARFLVYEERKIEIAEGDRIRITRNGETANGRRINNGDLFTVEKFAKSGDIQLHTGGILKADMGHLRLGYVETSIGSQSKSVKDVLVAQSSASFGLASSREQFYVSASRGKETLRIYTDDRLGLQQAVGNSSVRRAGVELVGFKSSELSSLMAELNAKQWQDHVQSRRPDGETKSHVQNLLTERRQNALKKQETMDWRQYVEMRRKMTTADGRSRARSAPAGGGQIAQKAKTQGKSFLRPTSRRVPLDGRAPTPTKPVQAPPKPVSPRAERFAKAFKAAGEHFNKIAKRGNLPRANPERKKTLPQRNIAEVAKRFKPQRRVETGGMKKNQAKTQKRVQAPPPPTPRKGR